LGFQGFRRRGKVSWFGVLKGGTREKDGEAVVLVQLMAHKVPASEAFVGPEARETPRGFWLEAVEEREGVQRLLWGVCFRGCQSRGGPINPEAGLSILRRAYQLRGRPINIPRRARRLEVSGSKLWKKGKGSSA
jgi:hypothetical protein